MLALNFEQFLTDLNKALQYSLKMDSTIQSF